MDALLEHREETILDQEVQNIAKNLVNVESISVIMSNDYSRTITSNTELEREHVIFTQEFAKFAKIIATHGTLKTLEIVFQSSNDKNYTWLHRNPLLTMSEKFSNVVELKILGCIEIASFDWTSWIAEFNNLKKLELFGFKVIIFTIQSP